MSAKRKAISAAIVAALVLGSIFLWRSRKAGGSDDKDENVQTEVAVHIGKIVRATLHRYVVAYGMVEPEPATEGNPPASARLASPLAGVIAEANCVEGQRVEKGAVLFRLDSRLADVLVEKAKQAMEFAERNFERQKKLREVEGTSVKLFQEAEQQLNSARSELANAQTQRALLKIEAPLAGTVVRVNAKPGEAVELNTVLAELIDLDRLVVSVNVPSSELASLKFGQPVEVEPHSSSANQRTNRVAVGKLSFISAEVDPKTDTVVVRAAVPANTDLRPGQFANIRVVCEERLDRLAVPKESVVTDGDGRTIIAVVEGDKAIQRPVQVGLRDGDWVEVSGDALREGMTVVTTDAYGLPNETKIRVLGQ